MTTTTELSIDITPATTPSAAPNPCAVMVLQRPVSVETALSAAPSAEADNPVPTKRQIKVPSVAVVEEIRRGLIGCDEELLGQQNEWVQTALARALSGDSNPGEVKQTYVACGIIKRAIQARKDSADRQDRAARHEKRKAAQAARAQAYADLVARITAANVELEEARVAVQASLKDIVLELLPEWVESLVTTSIADNLDLREADQKNLRTALNFAKREQSSYNQAHKHRPANPGSASKRVLHGLSGDAKIAQIAALKAARKGKSSSAPAKDKAKSAKGDRSGKSNK